MSLLETVFKYLIKENNKLIGNIINTEGQEKLSKLLADNDLTSNMDHAVI